MPDLDDKLIAASRQLALGAMEAERAFGPFMPDGGEEIEEWAHSAAWELGETFEVSWSDSVQEDMQTLDYLVSNWGAPPDEEALLQIALTWGAFVGDRILAAVGGSWLYRKDPLHHALSFPKHHIEYFPMHAVLARFLLGEEAGFEAGYHQLVEFLTSS